jgi:ferric-dicitrate binding protein FerR (iron transport regulator)
MMTEKQEKIILTTDAPAEQYSAEKSFEQLWQRISIYNVRKSRTWLLKVSAVAASVAIVALCGVMFFQSEKDETHVLNTETEKKQFTLPDGSKVFLNADSRLTYTDAFGEKERNVELSGEACFEVSKDAGKPFIVKAGDLSIQVIGTVFNVQAYPSDERIETTLLQGTVSVMQQSTSAAGIVLHPGQQLLFDKSAKNMTVNEIDVSTYASWQAGKLVFRQTALKDAFMIMERNFRVKIVLNNKSLEEREITGRFDLTDDMEKILDVIRETLPFEYEKQDNTLFIIK